MVQAAVVYQFPVGDGVIGGTNAYDAVQQAVAATAVGVIIAAAQDTVALTLVNIGIHM